MLVQSLALCGVVLTTHALRFVALGDWGDDDGFQPEVAAALGTWANQRPLDFVLSLGDNFYPHGVTSVNDTQWDTKWKEVEFLSFQIWPAMNLRQLICGIFES